MARGYYELPRKRPPPTFGPPRPRQVSVPSSDGSNIIAHLRKDSLESTGRQLHILILRAPGMATLSGPTYELGRNFAKVARFETVDSFDEASSTLLANPDAVFAPGLDTSANASASVKLMLSQYVANGGRLLTDARQLYELLQQSLGGAMRLSEAERSQLQKPDEIDAPV